MQYASPPQSTALVDVKLKMNFLVARNARSAPRPNALNVPFWSKRGETSEVPGRNCGLGKVAENSLLQYDCKFV
jgi:hypothetical protein